MDFDPESESRTRIQSLVRLDPMTRVKAAIDKLVQELPRTLLGISQEVSEIDPEVIQNNSKHNLQFEQHVLYWNSPGNFPSISQAL